jgi:hypothetical protein
MRYDVSIGCFAEDGVRLERWSVCPVLQKKADPQGGWTGIEDCLEGCWMKQSSYTIMKKTILLIPTTTKQGLLEKPTVVFYSNG